MEKAANNISLYLKKELGLTEDNYQVVNYGMIAIVQIIALIIILLFTGLLFNILIEGYILCFTVAILRKYSGGAHASSLEICTLLGVISTTAFAFVAKYILSLQLDTNQAVVLTLVIYIYSALTAYRLIPVDNPNKPIKSEEKKKRMRKNSFIILIVFFCISIGLILTNSKSFISYSFCVTLGMWWQIFSLTNPGTKIFHSFDNCLRIIINKTFKRRTNQ